MPIGLVVMKWDERVGTEIVAKYPEEIKMDEKTLMQVYSTHEYSGEPGMISLMVGSLNIASYYTGPEKAFYVLLLLGVDEDADAYEDGLVDASRAILQNLIDDKFLRMIPSIFQRLSIYPSLNDEQQLAMTYHDEVKRMIINRLREEGVVSKSELTVWLKDLYIHGFVDIDGVLTDLIKKDIIKESSVKGMPSELIFLINDLLIARIPPVDLLNNPSERGLPRYLVDDYLSQCKKYFQNYRHSEEDIVKIMEILIDPEVYEVLRLLRTTIATRNDLEKFRKKGVEDIDKVLKKLWNSHMIQVFQSKEGTEYYGLICDFYLSLLFPKYLLRTIKQEYEVKSKTDKALVEYLSVLEDAYYDMKSKEKKKAKSEI